MHARIVMFTLDPGSLPASSRLANRHEPVMRRLNGFRSVTWLHNDDAGQYGSFSLWDTRADAEAVSGVTELQLDDASKAALKGPPTVQIFEIAEVKG
jgi:heme-degrading monooxygenase HmoA